jgi:hypothetical protein
MHGWLASSPVVQCSIGAYITGGIRLHGPRTIMKRLLSRTGWTRYSLKLRLHRMDKVAGDLNVLLAVIAIGLAALDVTFLVTQKVIDRLP